jgi:hypothetical protein
LRAKKHFKELLGIDSSQKPMDSHTNYFLILKALTFASVASPWLLGPPFQLMKDRLSVAALIVEK